MKAVENRRHATASRQQVNRDLSPCSINLHIEELVLDGFARSDRYRIAEGVQRELARLASRSGTLRSLGTPLTVEQVAGGTFTVKADSSPKQTASQIARAIYQGLQRSMGTPAGLPGIRPSTRTGDGKR